MPTDTLRPVVAAYSREEEAFVRLQLSVKYPRFFATLDAARQATREAERERSGLEARMAAWRNAAREELDQLRAQLAEAAAVWQSLACMLGWDNVPPQRTLEDSLRALKAERDTLTQQLGEARVELQRTQEAVHETTWWKEHAAHDVELEEQLAAHTAEVEVLRELCRNSITNTNEVLTFLDSKGKKA